MSEHLKEEHLLAVSAMMSSQLRRHCNIFCVFYFFFTRHIPTGPRTA